MLLDMACHGHAKAGRPVEELPSERPAVSSTPYKISLYAYDKKGNRVDRADGLFVSSTGIVATPRHLLAHASKVTCETSEGAHFAVSGIVAADPAHDLVLLQTDAQRTEGTRHGNIEHVHAGDEILIGRRALDKIVADGIVLKVENLLQDYHWLLIKATNPGGLSGSPVFDKGGEAIGMISAELKENAEGTAVPIDAVEELLKSRSSPTNPEPVAELKPRRYDELSDDPDFKEAIADSARHDYPSALAKMALVANDFPESAACHACLGTFQAEMESWAEAEKSYRAAIKLKPDYALAWANLSIPLYFQGKPDEAIEACKKSISIKRDTFAAWTSLGGIYLKQGNRAAVGDLIEELKSFHTRIAYKIADQLSVGLDEAKAPAK